MTDTMAAQGQKQGKGHISLVSLTKHFGQLAAVDSIDLEIPSGGFFSLLGPSGCGKTTTLRLIAGFEQPSSGRVLLDGRDMANTPPSKRPVNTVFQSYALFPHLRVFDNVAFGLRRAHVPRDEVRRRVGEALELVQLSDLAAQKPRQLQVELKQLQTYVGITFVYVTHDQEEALTMSDRIAVINHGRVEQAASPR